MPPCAHLPSHPLDFSSAAYFGTPNPPLGAPLGLVLGRPYSHEDERHALQENLPAPMFPGNYAPMTRCCAYQDDVKPYVLSHQGAD